MDSLAAHAQAAVSGQNDQKGTFAVKVRPAASAPVSLNPARARRCARVSFGIRNSAHFWTGRTPLRVEARAACQPARARCSASWVSEMRVSKCSPVPRGYAVQPSVVLRTCCRDSPWRQRGREGGRRVCWEDYSEESWIDRARPHPGSLPCRDAGLNNALMLGRRWDA